jgi:phosphatidylglycerophosphatase A
LALARLHPVGLSPYMPGTCCSAVAVLAAPFLFLPLSFGPRCALLALLLVAGALLTDRAERLLGVKDPPELVIDELPGMWITLLLLEEPSPAVLFAAFILFRFFDIVKPWPISAVERRVPGGAGIMADDVVAGLVALACLEAGPVLKRAAEAFVTLLGLAP